MHRLIHTPLDLPDGQMAVTAVRYLDTSRGVAYTADLTRGGVPIGVLENDGKGGATRYQPSNDVFPAHAMDTWVAGCRDLDDSPVNDETVFEALVNEHESHGAVTLLDDVGLTAVRIVDDGITGPPIPWHRVNTERNRAVIQRTPLGATSRWERWTGTGWEQLTHIPSWRTTRPHRDAGSPPPAGDAA